MFTSPVLDDVDCDCVYLFFKAPNPPPEDPTLHELPAIVVEGIPTPVEKMTQVHISLANDYFFHM